MRSSNFPDTIPRYSLEARIDELEDRVEFLVKKIQNIDRTLQVPAAGFCPAIQDAFELIDEVYKKAGIYVPNRK